MMIMCNAIVIIEYDGRRLGLSNAPVAMEHDNNGKEQYPSKHNPCIITYKALMT
jgi:hypothetical protein|tara:strand:+ start:793 stop:954 length:162 start_codon:yes stop_codon:yes gene_type:complete